MYGNSCKMQHTLGLREWREPDLWLTQDQLTQHMLQKAVGAAGFPSVHPESCWPWWKGPALELASSCCCCFLTLRWEPARL